MVTNFYEKDWVNHIIVGIGIVVGVLILIGLYTSVKPLIGANAKALVITQKDNNTTITKKLSSLITIELPEALYPHENFIIIDNPLGTLEKVQEPTASNDLNWAIQFDTVKKGTADIIVKSNQASVSDFHVTLFIK